jgi:hypothetical protein
MERFYASLKQLPTELLSSSNSVKISELKMARWLTRDTFLEMSQRPFAASNGIGPDHLHNLMNIQDLLLLEMLIEMKLLNCPLDSYSSEKLEILAFIQLILLESPNIMEFLIDSAIFKELDPLVLESLINSCPAFKSCIHLIILESYSAIEDTLYYWNIVANLAVKYPSSPTLNMCTMIFNEFNDKFDSKFRKLNVKHSKQIVGIIEKIGIVFPKLDSIIRQAINIWPTLTPELELDITAYNSLILEANTLAIKKRFYCHHVVSMNKIRITMYFQGLFLHVQNGWYHSRD